MSIEPIDLGFIASWPASAGPQDPDVITGSGPWGPRVVDAFPTATDPALAGRPPVVALKPCCGEVLDGEDCDCADLLAELEQANRHPIIFRFPTRRAA